MVGHGGSSAGSYLADPTSPILSHCASIVATSTVRVKFMVFFTIIHQSKLDTVAVYTKYIAIITPRWPHPFVYLSIVTGLVLLCDTDAA